MMRNLAFVIPVVLVSFGVSACTTTSSEKGVPPVHELKSSPDSQVGRYATVKNEPSVSQINPLLAVSIFKFPPSVHTVGDAVSQVLSPTGYRLSDSLSDSVKQTLLKPLPVTNRKLGPVSIQTALEVLMGAEVYELERDPLHRLVNFQLKPSMATALGVSHDSSK
jgi:conjugative transfer region protein (TIGR03748 family)